MRIDGQPKVSGSTGEEYNVGLKYRMKEMRLVHRSEGDGVQLCSRAICRVLKTFLYAARKGSGTSSVSRCMLKRPVSRLLSEKFWSIRPSRRLVGEAYTSFLLKLLYPVT